MPPKSWVDCQHCGQPFSKRSLELHERRCTQRQDFRAEHELRELEGFHRPPPLPDWIACPNCGERYGEFALPPHVARCKRLRPHGANGFCARGAEPFQGLWGIGDISDAIRKLRAALGITDDSGMDVVRDIFRKWDTDGNGNISEEEMCRVLKQLCPDFTDEQIHALFNAADVNKDGSVNYEEFIKFLANPRKKLSQADLDALRAIFDRFDGDKDGLLDNPEFNNMLQNMLPHRADDFDVADIDGNGAIDFDEFVRYWTSMCGSPGFEANEFDEACDMFDCFDKDGSDELDRFEFAKLLNNLFPDHCEENEKHVDAEFEACDANSGGGISLAEFIGYYGRLRLFYGKPTGWPPTDPEARAATLAPDLIPCKCGLMFLPDRLPVHRRSCGICKKDAAAAAAEAAAARKRAQEAEAARRKAEDDEAAAAAAEEAARRNAEDDAARAAAAAAAEKKRRAAEEARRAAEAERKAREDAEAKANALRNARGGLDPCQYCGRTFLPDRLPVHERCCANRGQIYGIRPTMTPGETKATIGRYDIPSGKAPPAKPSGSIAGRM